MRIPSSEELLRQIMITIEVAWRNDIELSDIKRWLDNFTGEVLGDEALEKNLALWMLYNFTYFNEEEIKHLCRLMLKKYLHNTLQSKKVSMNDISEILTSTLFLPLGRNSESGAYVLYLFRQENDLPVMFFGDRKEINIDQKVAFIDDMTLSGEQALEKIIKVKYAGYEINKFDIKEEFISCLRNENGCKKLTNYIQNHLICDKYNKDKIAEVLNEKIIKNINFYNETKDFFREINFDINLANLIDRYNRAHEDLNKWIVYKMNRMLLETYYNGLIQKAEDNTRVKEWFLLSFIASNQAKEKLKEENIDVISCIEIDDSSKAFSNNSLIFGTNVEQKNLCKKMCEYYGKKIRPQYPLGFNDGQYLFGLYYTIPNNVLPIFWAAKRWNPLFIRHEKNNGGAVKDVFGKFI